MTLLLCLVAVLAIGVGGVLAFIVTNTGFINNVFNPSNVTCEVEENTEGNIKSDVTIKNTGKVPAYIRAEVIITWKDKDGNVFSTLPANGEDKNYTIEFNTNGNWILDSKDGYYYYKQPVEAEDSTAVLIENCQPMTGCEEADYYLNVEIIASAIQADGGSYVQVGEEKVWQSAVQQAWSNDIVNVNVVTGDDGVKRLSVAPVASN